jgi:uncharacterized surface protein with fasciclin (FAS1) repeats
MPENKDMLTKVLTAHVVTGTWTSEMFREEANSEGFVNLETVSGDALSVQVKDSGASTCSTSRATSTRSPLAT